MRPERRPESPGEGDGGIEPYWWVHSLEVAARLSPSRARALRTSAGIGGVLIAVVGALALVGMATGRLLLARTLPSLPVMSPWTALAMIIQGIGVFLPTVRDTGAVRRVAIACGTVVAAIGLTFIVEHALGLQGPGDGFLGLFPDHVDPLGGRPAVGSSVALLLLGLGLVAHKVHRVAIAQYAMLVPIGIGYLSVVSHLLGVDRDSAPVDATIVGLNSAVCVVIAGLSVLCLQADQGVIRIVSGATAGGELARRNIVLVLVAPALIAVLTHFWVRGGVIGTDFALAFYATVTGLTGVLATVYEAQRLRWIDLGRAGAHAALDQVRRLEAEQRRTVAQLETANRRLDGVLTSALDAFITLDVRGEIVSWNPGATALYGYTGEQALGKRLDQILTIYLPDGSRLEREVDGRYLEGAVERGPIVYSVRGQDGALVEVESRVWGQDDGDDRLYTVIVRDVGERLRKERELREANKSLDEFAALAAHDLRGPLTAVRGLAELLLDEAEEKGNWTSAELAARLDAVAVRGSDLVDGLLAFAQAGRFESTVPVALGVLVQEVAADVRAASARAPEIVVAALPVVDGDELALRQVFTNLLSNAVAYCPEDRVPRVEVTALDSPSRRDATVFVDDNGEGIPTDEWPTLFDMFQRASTGLERPGAGVGLAICRRVVEAYGGSIEVDDAPGGGARFALELPRSVDGLVEQTLFKR